MSVFGSILDKIFHHGNAAAQAQAGATAGAGTGAGQPSQRAAPPTGQQGQQPAAAGQASGATSTGQQGAGQTQAAQPGAGGQRQLSNIDVEAVLTKVAAGKGGGGNWRTSIVDLLKLLDLDSSLAARKELASELDVHAGADGSAEQNIALQKAVMQKLAENGGNVPESLRH